MREHLGYSDLCNEVMMTRSVHRGAFVLVEGVTDDRVYGKFLSDEARILQCHSKDTVKRCIKELVHRRGVREAIGIVDADLDLLDRKCPESPVFYTDNRDMEMMCIGSNALKDVLDEYGDREKLRTFREKHGPVRDALIAASYPVGLLMHVSKRNGLDLNFGDLDVSRFIDPKTLAIDLSAMVDTVVMNSRPSGISRKRVLRLLESEIEDLDNPWYAARGHDTVDILLLALRKGFGSFNARSLTSGALGGSLRLAFSDSDFEDTRLYRDTRKWAEKAGLKLWNIEERTADATSWPIDIVRDSVS